ncbi:unnamed protein product [Penicillium salamii]|uniref:Uncharacterized protein n=1 Tax=Penicillium salamii TaxID=1612424 RepID=A0A9W4K6I7_9EURO|nr:unnamed protein product [Penicillium salamii]CAG8106604.1 unnamed protein product [Penicillium salamii]CAG8185188.1 unnamed protein product [Penicillium salamii]CAG8196692.1 unnamed protein product [Penicillium salamii]CAG8203429.1 unnamed protein product [Penicillium salamii]
MAPIPRVDLDGDNPSSDVGDSQDSPLRRQFSEPFRPQSTSTQMSQSPEPIQQVKCDWCGKLLMLPNDQKTSADDVLNDHINEAHPKSMSFGYDGAEDGADETYDETGDLQDDDAAEEEEDEEVAVEVEAAQPEDTEPQDGKGEGEGEETTIEITTEDANGIQPTTVAVSVKNVPEGKLDLLEWLSNPRTSYPEEYRARVATWKREDVKQRLHRFWTVHRTTKFSPAYEPEASKCEATWENAFNDPSKSKKREASEPLPHILPYKKAKVERDNFLEIQTQEVENLVAMLRTPEKYSPEELYAISQTAALVMKTFQDEWLALDKLYLKANRHKRDDASYEAKKHQLQGHKKKGGAPLAHVYEDKIDFEEKKEAMLYGYKHTYFPNHTPLIPIRQAQDPFVQGGFVPTPAQARKMNAKQKEYGDRNMDNWTTMKKHGLEYVPQMYEKRSEPATQKVTRKRKAAEVELSSKQPDTDDDGNPSDPNDETEEEGHSAKRRSRPRGGKRGGGAGGAGRGESYNSDNNSRRGSGRGRGRGRGRGNGRLASSRATFEVTPAPTSQPSSRGRGRRGASTMGSSATPSAENTFPATEPTAAESPSEPGAGGAKKETLSLEAIEETRRQKIANSKNPKRTKAMLDHWDRFNREGRIRNPKRSKAQIEQDRTVDGADDSMTMGPAGPGRRKRSPSLAPLAGNLAPKGPGLPSMASVQAQQHMPPTFPPMGVAHYGPGPINPYGPPPPAPPMAQLGQPMPPQYAPFPYVQYGMGHLPGSHDPRDPRH